MLKTGANPGALPPIAEAPLSSVPSLVRGRPDEEGVPRDDMEHRDYDVFISHASEDKDDVVRPLAHASRMQVSRYGTMSLSFALAIA
jgi:hypothetical protein